MRVRDLQPGMLIEPIEGANWILIPWRGHDGEIAGEYLSVSSMGSTSFHPSGSVSGTRSTSHFISGSTHHSWIKPVGPTPLLYIGPLDRSDDGDMHTPGRQLMFHAGRALSVDPASWRYLVKTDKNK
jgi:hypothetical protein